MSLQPGMNQARIQHNRATQTQLFLLGVGPLLKGRPDLFKQAALLFANTDLVKSSNPLEEYQAALALCQGPPVAAGERLAKALPAFAKGQFPFNKPTPLLCDQVHAIEAMLAPLSDRRAKAHLLSKRLAGSRGSLPISEG